MGYTRPKRWSVRFELAPEDPRDVALFNFLASLPRGKGAGWIKDSLRAAMAGQPVPVAPLIHDAPAEVPSIPPVAESTSPPVVDTPTPPEPSPMTWEEVASTPNPVMQPVAPKSRLPTLDEYLARQAERKATIDRLNKGPKP